MANTFTSLHCHVVFGTKHREPWISHAIEERLWAYLGGIAKQHHARALCIGGMPEHVHLLLGLPPTLCVSAALKALKGGSSVWVKEHLPGCRSFAWQDGYGAFSVSKSQIPGVEAYIRGQREHHRSKTFQEEYRALIKRHGIEFEESFLWD